MGRVSLVAVAALAFSACQDSRAEAPRPPPAAPSKAAPPSVVPRDRPRPDYRSARVWVQAPGGDLELKVEVAETDPQRMHGLMFKEKLGDDEGMIFLFPDVAPRWFWMKNTLIPLDMIFVGEDRKVVGIYENATPLSQARMGVEKPSKYVLEVNGGWSRRMGIGPGTQLRFGGVEP